MTGRKTLYEKENDFGKIVLWEHSIDGKKEYELIINGIFIMASYNCRSSELLIKKALNQIDIQDIRLLIGGLGLGYSVKEALRHSGKIKKITVAEINNSVIECNRTVLYNLNGKYLSDDKVELINEDFIKYIYSARDKYHCICMDIDNGPMLVVKESNKEAYSIPFFTKITTLLKKDGVFVIWSCNKDNNLLTDMKDVFKKCSVEEVYELHNDRKLPYYLYFGVA